MILFLDTVSPVAKFHVIEDNNIVQSINIINKKDNKISDCIIPAFLKLEKKIQIKKNITKLVTCTGPGSYTALRIGIAFIYGLSLSMKIPLIGISCPNIIKLLISKNKESKTLIFICSSNDQYFYCLINKNSELCINKLEFNRLSKLVHSNHYSSSISNYQLPNNLMKILDKKNHVTKSFEKILSSNYNRIKLFKSQKILSPIYTSDNFKLN